MDFRCLRDEQHRVIDEIYKSAQAKLLQCAQKPQEHCPGDFVHILTPALAEVFRLVKTCMSGSMHADELPRLYANAWKNVQCVYAIRVQTARGGDLYHVCTQIQELFQRADRLISHVNGESGVQLRDRLLPEPVLREAAAKLNVTFRLT